MIGGKNKEKIQWEKETKEKQSLFDSLLVKLLKIELKKPLKTNINERENLQKYFFGI